MKSPRPCHLLCLLAFFISWLDLLRSDWSGRWLLSDEKWGSIPGFQLSGDACTVARGFLIDNRWCYDTWSTEDLKEATRAKKLSMVFLEAKTVVEAVATFGSEWEGKKVKVQSDNETTVTAWNNKKAKEPALRGLLKSLYYLTTLYSCEVELEHIAGVDNKKADALSRSNFKLFKQLHPTADLHRTPIRHFKRFYCLSKKHY